VQRGYVIVIRKRAGGRLEIRVRPPDGPEQTLSSLEALYRYLVERLRPAGPPLG